MAEVRVSKGKEKRDCRSGLKVVNLVPAFVPTITPWPRGDRLSSKEKPEKIFSCRGKVA